MSLFKLPSIAALVLLALLTACAEKLPPEELLARGRQALEAGDYNAATIDAKAALQQQPRNAEGRRLMGDIAMAQAAYGDAASEYERSLSFERVPEVATYYAVALIEGAQYQKLLDEALDGRFEGLENNAIILAALANAEAVVGNRVEANEMIERALRNTADDPFVRVVEVRLLATSDGDMELAREKAEALTADYPEYAPGFSILAAVASMQGDIEDSIAAFGEAGRLNPQRLRDRMAMVAAQLAIGDAEGAREEVDKLAQVIPNNPIVRFYQGRLALADGEIEAGLGYLDQVLADIPNHPGALYFAGLANLEEGNLLIAEQQLANFLALSPGHVQTRLALSRLYLQKGEPERAETLATAILKENPGSAGAARILAAALGARGDFASSAKMYGQVLAAAETPDLATQLEYGTALMRSDNEAGVAELEKARDMDPMSERARALLVAAYLAGGDVAKARAEVDDYLAAAPDTATAHVLLGQVELWEGNDEAAKTAFDRALELDPASRGGIRGSAGLALRAGDADNAEAVFLRALEQYPDNVETLMNLAFVQEQQGDMAAMSATLQRAVDADAQALAPRIILARQLMREGKYGDGVALLAPLRDQYPDVPELYELLAGGFFGLGEMESAVTAARRLVELRPDDASALRMLAVSLQGKRDFDAAEVQIKRSMELDPTDPQSRQTLVELFLLQQKYDELGELLAGYPEEVQQQRDVKLARGRVELMRGNSAGAVGFLQDAHEMGADSRSVFLLVSALLREGRTGEAEREANAWLEDHPDDASILQQYSTYLLSVGRDADGAELLERLYAMAPENIVVLNNLAWAYRTNNPERGLELVNEALKAAPDNMSIMDTKSMILYESGDYRGALSANDQALRVAPGFPQLLFHRGQILAAMGRVDEAIQALRKVERADFAEKPQAAALLAELRGG